MQRKTVTDELAQIQQANGGLLQPAHVVAFARDPETALHARFEWDDTEAAQQWRLAQAREVIRLNVKIIGESVEPVRAFISLPSDRLNGGGYRSIEDVVSDDSRRAEMLQDAMARLVSIKRKYMHLQALRPIWDAMERIEDSPPARAAG